MDILSNNVDKPDILLLFSSIVLVKDHRSAKPIYQLHPFSSQESKIP